jgi:hypothetical protein
MIWDLLQQVQIQETADRAHLANQESRSNTYNTQQLEAQLQTLALACQAMWELTSKRLDLSELDLIDKMAEIDKRDGKVDGKLSQTELTHCPDCKKTIKNHRTQCYWCGALLVRTTPFIK